MDLLQSICSRRLLINALPATLLASRMRVSSAAGKEIVIGQVASLSGSNGADLGHGLKSGIEACFSSVNAGGGIRGRTLRLVSKDDRYVPSETVRLTRELIQEERPAALIGFRGTANTIALIESKVLVEQAITLVGTLTGAREVQAAPGILNLRTSYELELEGLFRQVQSMGLDTVGVLYVDDAFGRSGLAAIEGAAHADAKKLLVKIPYDKSADKVNASLQDAAARLAAAGAKAIILVAVGDPVYKFIKTFRSKNTSTLVFCMSVVDPSAVFNVCGSKLAGGVGFSQVYPYPYSDKIVLVREYRKALLELSNALKPNYFSLEGYIYARVLVEALKRAPENPNSAQMNIALNGLPHMNLGGFMIEIDPITRNGVRFVDLTVLTAQGKLLG